MLCAVASRITTRDTHPLGVRSRRTTAVPDVRRAMESLTRVAVVTLSWKCATGVSLMYTAYTGV